MSQFWAIRYWLVSDANKRKKYYQSKKIKPYWLKSSSVLEVSDFVWECNATTRL